MYKYYESQFLLALSPGVKIGGRSRSISNWHSDSRTLRLCLRRILMLLADFISPSIISYSPYLENAKGIFWQLEAHVYGVCFLKLVVELFWEILSVLSVTSCKYFRFISFGGLLGVTDIFDSEKKPIGSFWLHTRVFLRKATLASLKFGLSSLWADCFSMFLFISIKHYKSFGNHQHK